MKLLPVLIFLQLIFGIFLLSLSNNDKRVLGLSSNLAQSDILPGVTPEPPTPPPPSETTAPATSEPTTPETSTPPQIPTGEVPTATSQESTTPPVVPLGNSPEPESSVQTQTILEPSNTINSIENISQTTIDKAAQEDTGLEGTVDPEAKNNLIIEIASNQVKDLDKLIDSNDNTSANFIAQRLNNKIETAINNLNSLPDDKKGNAQQKLINFCNNSDPSLRVAELSVPEEIQQDIEITRGLCQAL